ncbi:SYSM protein, partial [Tichodroma muraria]|nr:SYSM protein [Tichodroma muraria]
LRQLPELAALRERGRSLRGQLRALEAEESDLEQRFYLGALQLPNRTHPAVPVGDQSQARLLEVVGEKPGKGWGVFWEVLGRFFVGGVRKRRVLGGKIKGLASVTPSDSCAPQEGCGVQPSATPSPVYTIDPARFEDLCLAGTSEVGIAGYFMDHAVQLQDLPVKVVCSSTCYRTETDTGQEPWGLYRVHQFTKVEMFGLTAAERGTESEELLDEFLGLQKEIFSELGLHYR